MRKYSVIFFDLDNTLLDFYASEKKAIRRVLGMHGLPNGEREAQIYSEINLSFWKRYERGEIKREDIFENRFYTFLERMGLKGDVSKISEDYFHCLSEGHDLMEGAADILKWLKSEGIRVYATTNGITLTQYKRIKDAGIEPYFDGVFVSEEVGAQKPSKQYFDFVLRNIPEVKKSEILIVGDSPSSDILGGINSGIDTCWFADEKAECEYQYKFRVSSLADLRQIV